MAADGIVGVGIGGDVGAIALFVFDAGDEIAGWLVVAGGGDTIGESSCCQEIGVGDISVSRYGRGAGRCRCNTSNAAIGVIGITGSGFDDGAVGSIEELVAGAAAESVIGAGEAAFAVKGGGEGFAGKRQVG